LGVAALVIAIIGLVFCWSVVGGVILGICAVIIGFVARSRVKRGEATNGGVAIAGIVLGFLAIIVSLIFIPIWIGVFDEVGGTDYVDCLAKAGSDEQAIQQCADQFRDRVENEFSVTLTPTR
jgi:heme/copper-type cytochrome/quinol oxidase subunit 2